MERLTAALERHHKLCDTDFAAAEERARCGDWRGCGRTFRGFREQLEQHFGVEETTLFPAFEQRTGMSGGPTQVMRREHALMRSLLQDLDAALQQQDAAAFAGSAETLLVLLQQHNLKEENILYPMCDEALAADSGALRTNIEAVLHGEHEEAGR